MTLDATAIAAEFYAATEQAWNDADGAAFGGEFGDDTIFVDIRGVKHHGGAQEIAASHQWIFDTIYKGSVIRYELTDVLALGDEVIVANGHATLDCPSGPLEGVHEAISTVVLVPVRDTWKAVRFHNTMVTEHVAA